MYFSAAFSGLFICALFLQTQAFTSAQNGYSNGDLRQPKYKQENEISNTNSVYNNVNHRQSREDEDEDGTHRPALYPLLVKLFATSIGANETQANKTAERFVENHNIYYSNTDPSSTSQPTKLTVSEEEEDEDEESEN